MSDDDIHNDSESAEFDGPEERALRERLAASVPRPSAQHDNAILAAARTFTDEAHDDPQASDEASPKGRLPRWPVAAAAVLALGVAITLVLPALETAEPIVRSGEDGLNPERNAELGVPPAAFTLPASYAGLSCQITLVDASGATRWQSDAFEGSIALPTPIASTFGDGRYQWRGGCVGRGDVRFGPYGFRLTR